MPQPVEFSPIVLPTNYYGQAPKGNVLSREIIRTYTTS